MKILINFSGLCMLMATAILAGCSKDESSLLPPDVQVGNNSYSYSVCNLIAPAGQFDGGEVSDQCFLLNVPKEGGRYSFQLSEQAYTSVHKNGEINDYPITSYTFLLTKAFEISYDSKTIPQAWSVNPAELHRFGATMTSIADNTSAKRTTLSSDWFDYFGGTPDAFTVEIKPNSQGRERQFCFFFGKSSDGITDAYVSYTPYSLVIIQAGAE